ncbi:MAG: recombinase family protein [Lachnospiraceae bacterium]|nr:recombinase family protein [Lachnospiraceae bacterium]
MEKMLGYVRVSSTDQNLDRQLIAMREYGVPEENIFADHGFSGKDFNRPAYQEMLTKLNAGDRIVIKSVDRLGRNFDEMLDEWGKITRKMGVEVIVLDMPYLNATGDLADIMQKMINTILLDMTSGFAQLEREKIHERQKEGIAAAKARGVHCGRPKKKRPANFIVVKGDYLDGKESLRSGAKQLGISHATFRRWVNE